VTFAAGAAISQAENGEGVDEWQDKSGNGNHARATHGNVPTMVDDQINNQSVVRFNDGTMLSSLTEAIEDEREFTVLGVIKPNFSTSDADARFVTAMSNDQSSDEVEGSSLVPLLRNSNGSGFSSIYAGTNSSNRTNYTCGVSCDSTAFIVSSVFRIESDTTIEAALKGNGQVGADTSGISPSTANPPYTFNVDEIYFGGRRTGASPGSGELFFNGDYAEIAIYDKALTCREVEALEEYFREKWDLYSSPAETTCPANTIPTL
jgi:hypothetical protein